MKRPKIEVYFAFENELCKIGSVLDGQNLYDLIQWETNENYEQTKGLLMCHEIPKIGELIHLSRDAFWFEVIAVKHNVTDWSHHAKVMLRQIQLNDPRTKW